MTTFQAIARLHALKEQQEQELQYAQERAKRNKDSKDGTSEMREFYAKEIQKLKENVAALEKAGQMMSKR